MPVIDETRYTLEIKAANKRLQERIESLEKRIVVLEEKAAKAK